ncbi:MAG TPA: YIP1 family protein [Nitrospiria bacterium]|nr:YIP1 family protein [Nitrospiria bacterium]
MEVFIRRMIRAAKLDAQLYEEVEADKSAMGQALGVVVLSGVAAGIGTIGRYGGYGHILEGLIAALIGWFIWAILAYWLGTRILPEPQTSSNMGELLRTVGFSSSPGLLRVLGVLPGVTDFIIIVTSVWMLASMVVAIRQALDYESTLRALSVCAIGWIIQFLILILTIRAAAM